jgi:hypothetical protein
MCLDPGKNLFRIPDADPGVKKAPDPGSGSSTLFATNRNNNSRMCYASVPSS